MGDPVDGDLPTHKRPQPRPSAADPPAGLITGDHRAGPHPLDQGLIGRLATPRGAGDGLADPARGDLKAEVAKQPGDLAGRHAQALAEPARQRHHPGTKLGAGRAQRIRGLRRVAGLHPAAACTAAADLDLVAGHQRPGGRQLLLILHRHPFHDQLAAAARTAPRQPHRHDLVDVLGRAPVGAGAIGRAGLAAGTLGVGDGVAFGERGGLALGRPAQRLHLTAQPLVDLLEPFAFGPQPLVLPTQPLAFGLQPLLLALQPLLLLSQCSVLVLKPSDPLAQPTHASRIPTGLHTRGHPHHEAEGYNQPIRRQAPAISIPGGLGFGSLAASDIGLCASLSSYATNERLA